MGAPALRRGRHRGRQARVLRLLRQHHLLAPTRTGAPHGPKAHDRHIVSDAPNVMWGADGTRFSTEQDGWYWLLTAVDHCASEIVGHYVTKRGHHGHQYAVRDFRAGLAFLGIRPPGFVGEPEGNGVAERAFRTIKE